MNFTYLLFTLNCNDVIRNIGNILVYILESLRVGTRKTRKDKTIQDDTE